MQARCWNCGLANDIPIGARTTGGPSPKEIGDRAVLGIVGGAMIGSSFGPPGAIIGGIVGLALMTMNSDR